MEYRFCLIDHDVAAENINMDLTLCSVHILFIYCIFMSKSCPTDHSIMGRSHNCLSLSPVLHLVSSAKFCFSVSRFTNDLQVS